MAPKQQPGKSKQDYGTPRAFLRASERLLCIRGYTVDLAASHENKVVHRAFTEDSLSKDWEDAIESGWGWLNPPFGDIAPWADKASSCGARVAMLVPASVGSNWWAAHVHGRAYVVFLQGRLTFVGTPPDPKTGKPDPYPKDCALLLFGGTGPGYTVWDWRIA